MVPNGEEQLPVSPTYGEFVQFLNFYSLFKILCLNIISYVYLIICLDQTLKTYVLKNKMCELRIVLSLAELETRIGCGQCNVGNAGSLDNLFNYQYVLVCFLFVDNEIWRTTIVIIFTLSFTNIF